MGWTPDTFLDITSVWDKTRAAMEYMQGQVHMWDDYTRVAQQRANHFKRTSDGTSGGRDCLFAEEFGLDMYDMRGRLEEMGPI